LYRRECEPVVQMLNTAGRVVAWGVIPLWEVGSISKKVSLRQKSEGVSVHFRGVRRCFVCYQVSSCLIPSM
jgi:hypothetical protein